jgi:hypothetical protein
MAKSKGEKADRYTWSGADPEALEVTASRVARHISRAGVRVVGLLPTGADLVDGAETRRRPRMAPLLATLASAIVRFVDQDVSIVDHWQTWKRDDASPEGEESSSSRLREVRPRVLEVTPRPAADAEEAAAALQNTLGVLRRGGIGFVLVNLGGFAAPGTAPSTLSLCDGVALVVVARRARITAVESLARHIPEPKWLGAIWVDRR